MEELTKLTLVETLEGLEDKKFSTEELCVAYTQRIGELDSKLNAFLTVNEECGGIPVAVKDIIVTKGIKTTAGSKILETFIPPYNATVIERLFDKGVGVIGKTNCDEFAMGSSGENSAYGCTRNPWDLERVPGGSSSGSAAAVAANLCVFALGTDTGGSVRQPASLCGVVGFKPTYGLVSRYGLIAYGSSLDCVGSITKSVEDAATVLEWISGPDGKDSNCSQQFKLDRTKLKSGVKGLIVGIPGEYFSQGLDKKVKEVIKTSIRKLEALGCKTVEVELAHTKYAIATYYIIATSEASANLSRYDGIRFGGARDLFGQEVKRRIMLGTFSLSVGYYDDYYAKAARVRTLIKQDFEKVFERCDVIVGPVSPTTAWKLGEKLNDPLSMYLSDIYTVTANLAGLPGLSVPCGFADNLPVGLQILGPRFSEEKILRVGYVCEQVGGRKLRPDVQSYSTSGVE
ncbi:MAG: Asp-tRNA(Asn)/Glu-tRNA(Gln) amidotransferase subunit GatA [Candidatus Blackburnbacteria bacterium]|nr:Asp-tRNA(Asn)/Glu-tRNA(Gln) amidotransferase subunit GatA [Candidatus Blackburnbacteria bacterium]